MIALRKLLSLYGKNNLNKRSVSNKSSKANAQPPAMEGLQFRLSEQEAVKRLNDNQDLFEQSISNRDDKFQPIKSLTLSSDNHVQWKSCFIPFYTMDVQHLQSGFLAEYGIDRTEIHWVWVSNEKGGGYPMPQTRTVTDWYHTQGIAPPASYPFGRTLQTQIYAGFDYPREPLEKALVMEDVTNITSLVHKEGSVVLPFQMKVKMALSIVLEKLHELESERVCEYIRRQHGADHARIRSLDVHLDQATVQWISYYVPCFIYSYTVGEMKLYKFLNGYTGEIDGERIYSPWKVATVGAVIGAGLTSYVTRTIALRVLFPGTLIPGLFAAGAMYLYSKFRYYNNRQKMEQEQKDNRHKFQECDLDENLRWTAASNNHDTENSHVGVIIHEQLARLLGLSSTSPVTIQQVKQAYHKQLQKYHPDVYRGNNKEFAELMTQQLNTEYEKFTKQTKQSK